ncbi:MAG: PTS sugar transporter subunit IIA [Lentisphaerae bacterium]|jgi:mannitol/fructose-specific phosphotransferase system IIA component (Ntr-type)|nr:PTS sugar transporter subunit IIA [Lentisphaerota bacterium]
MDLKVLLPKEHVLFGLPLNISRRELLRLLSEPLAEEGAIDDIDVFLDAVERREAEMSTQMNGGTVFPHASSATVQRLAITVGVAPEPGFPFDPDADEKGRVFFLIAIPAAAPAAHLPLLTHLAGFITAKGKLEKLLQADSAAAVHKMLLAWTGK